ncbi:MAG: radical SAM protein, partial [Armatimonadetes bacterium]|nr:radical SAM protein [Armatimonadota bacterium]
MLKEKRPDMPVIWGGWHVSILPEQSINNPYIDIIVRGQGEETIKELALKLKNKLSLKDILGITYKENGRVVNNPNRPIESLDKFPPLAYHLIDIKKYPGRRSSPSKIYIAYRTSQGCPYRCAFCADPLVFKRKVSILSSHRTGDELESLIKKYEVNEVLFCDDTFFLNYKRVEEICGEIIKRDLKISWEATSRAGTIANMSDELLNLIKKSGCRQIHPGIEGSSQGILDYIKKDEKYENTFICAEKLAKAGIRALYSFIVGFPGEPKEAVDETFKAIKKLKEINPDNIMPVNFYTPYPGNVLYDKAKEYGFIEPKSLDEWADFNTRRGNTPWLTKKFKEEVMKRDKYYLPAAYPSKILKEKMEKGKFKWIYKIFHKIAKFRVKHDFYFFDLDWKILLAYWKFWE